MNRIKIQDRNWTEIQAYYDQGHSTRETEKHFKLSTGTRAKAGRLGLFKARTISEAQRFVKRKPCSPEARQRMSEAKKKWNRENPDKVREVFSRLSKTRSVPCEHLKEWLKEQHILFVEEYQPLLDKGRYYSIDIAFPDRKIGVEVNGDMHYGRDGQLREYYQIRHDTIEADGWKLYEVPRKTVFNADLMKKLFNDILSADSKQAFDFLAYVPPAKKKDAPKVPKVPKPRLPIIAWPAKEELIVMVYQQTLTAISKACGASLNGLKSHCRKHDINYPPMGYWRRRQCGYLHEEAMVSQARKNKPRHSMTETDIEIAKQFREQGWSFMRIGKRLGFAHTCIRKTLKKRGIEGKANWSRTKASG